MRCFIVAYLCRHNISKLFVNPAFGSSSFSTGCNKCMVKGGGAVQDNVGRESGWVWKELVECDQDTLCKISNDKFFQV